MTSPAPPTGMLHTTASDLSFLHSSAESEGHRLTESLLSALLAPEALSACRRNDYDPLVKAWERYAEFRFQEQPDTRDKESLIWAGLAETAADAYTKTFAESLMYDGTVRSISRFLDYRVHCVPGEFDKSTAASPIGAWSRYQNGSQALDLFQFSSFGANRGDEKARMNVVNSVLQKIGQRFKGEYLYHTTTHEAAKSVLERIRMMGQYTDFAVSGAFYLNVSLPTAVLFAFHPRFHGEQQAILVYRYDWEALKATSWSSHLFADDGDEWKHAVVACHEGKRNILDGKDWVYGLQLANPGQLRSEAPRAIPRRFQLCIKSEALANRIIYPTLCALIVFGVS